MKTRKPTGRAPWPIILIAGAEKAGKSWAAAQATGHESIRNAYWLGIGEDDPDEYANVPGADFEIVEHDGTYQQIRDALRELVQIPQDPTHPDLLIVDSMGRLWAQLSDLAQQEANARAAEKARKYNRAAPSEEVPIGMDLWNRAKGRWGEVLDLLRAFQGPVILTARLTVVTVVDAEGKPTKEKSDKIEAEKNLPYDVAAVVKMPERGVAILTGVRSAKLQMAQPTKLRDFTVASLWEAMGVGEDMGERRHAGQSPAPADDPQEPAAETAQQWVDAIHGVTDLGSLRALWGDAQQKGALTDGLKAAFGQRSKDLQAVAA